MLIAITILAILASAVIPASSSAGPESIQAAARILANDLMLARGLAIQHNTQWSVRFDPTENSYELVHTGSGSFPVPENALAPPSQSNAGYIIDFDELRLISSGNDGVDIAGVALSESGSAVTDIEYGPMGGSGPARSEDTLIVLTRGSGKNMQTLTVTISWVTGQAWIGEVGVIGSGS